MKYNSLILTKVDFKRLKKLLDSADEKDVVMAPCYQKLQTEIRTAVCFSEEEFPSDVIRFGSIIDIETPYSTLIDYELVTPLEADAKRKKLSILSPMGSALIGYAEGDTVTWNFPAGEKEIRILRVSNKK